MKKVIVWITVLNLLMMCGCNANSNPKETSQGCSEDGACSVVEQEENSFIPLTMEEALQFFEEKKTGIMYFGFPDCPWCHDVVPILEKVSKEMDESVYYVRTRKGKKDNYEKLYTEDQRKCLVGYVGEYMSENEEGVVSLYVPLVVSINHGVCVSGHVGTVEGHDAHKREIKESEIKEVYDIFLGMFKKLK